MEERDLVSVSCLHLMLKQGHELLMVMDSLLGGQQYYINSGCLEGENDKFPFLCLCTLCF